MISNWLRPIRELADQRLEELGALDGAADPQRDGYAAVKALLPPRHGATRFGRGLVLVDPPYEAQLEEFDAIIGALQSPAVQSIPEAFLPNFGLTFQPTAGNGSVVSQDLEDDGVTWRITGRYAVTDDTSLYANYARGRRPAVRTASARSL